LALIEVLHLWKKGRYFRMKQVLNIPPRYRKFVLLIGLLVIVLVGGIVYADNPGTATTTTGQELIIEILDPLDGEALACGEPITVSGQTSIGDLDGSAHVAYVVDESGSTTFVTGLDCNGDGIGGNAGDDFNFNGVNGDILDCEISGVKSLNESLFDTNTTGSVIGFGSSSFVADVGPTAGQQGSTFPLDADVNMNGEVDIEEVIRSMYSTWPGNSFIDRFTQYTFAGNTNFDAAINSVIDVFATVPTDTLQVAFFLSDGDSTTFSTGPGSPLQNAASNDIVINTFSVGNGAAGCGPTDSLGIVANVTGGTCTEVLDPSELSTVLPGVTPTGIEFVQVGVTGFPPVVAALDPLGNWSASFPPSVPGQNYMIEASVFAEDGTVATADISVTGGLCATDTPTPTNTPEPTVTNTPTNTPVPTATNTPTNTPEPPQEGCTRTQGYWKNHPDDWPVDEITIGGVTYTKQEAIDILKTAPRRDATYILAHQLIAAKLNILNGADGSAVAATIVAADNWLMDNPLGSNPDNPARLEGIALARTLDEYNNGIIGPGHCDSIEWG
jgi:hypothetical protein